VVKTAVAAPPVRAVARPRVALAGWAVSIWGALPAESARVGFAYQRFRRDERTDGPGGDTSVRSVPCAQEGLRRRMERAPKAKNPSAERSRGHPQG
jgi:hypothetical protein